MEDAKPARQLNPSAFEQLNENAARGPVVMLNLLRFKPDGGAESYAAYAEAVTPLLEKCGGEVVYAGQPNELLIGEDRWDLMILVRYPTRAAFVGMVTSDDYLSIAHLREQALEDSVVYATDPAS
jgi:uncharacterized protein (DUF1330 family)